MRLIAIALLFGLAACDRQRETSVRADSTAAARVQDSLALTASGDVVIARWRARVPDSVFIRKGACPFECCGYTEWALRDSAVVVTEPRRGAVAAFVLPDSTRFMADSGFVRVTDVQLIVVGDTIDQRPYAALFLPGDTMVVLDYVGEGHWKVFYKDRIVEVEGFWGAEQPGLPVAEMLGRYSSEWWAHITMKDARKGWLLIVPPMQVIGADGCGGPPYWIK
jgi:hypothetical protein